MNSTTEWLVAILFIVVLSLMVAAVPMRICYQHGYKKGQIDAALGTQNYYLKAMPDSTRKWMRVGLE